ncbi:SRPBCC family protein [Phycicoccus sp. CSK15P-2]|uniref:SRPBCC family protein n=1 Tax=Phycicoccus sp. CSK15P-2 TaxID=2807627 RepID=UPI0019503BF9|nr:SRPBCC family protein [Phycicoccus sp. CSK15P-2]MBM6406145.1 SRPBCC family protein [Phycicoccus sp. CSK15P-2]
MSTPYTVSRGAVVAAPPERIRPLLHDFHAWRRWSPWEDLDPDMQRTYTGAERGVGARYAWDGDKKAGRGTMEVVRDEPERVEVDLAFEKPFPSRSRVEFVLTPRDAGTHVAWLMHGELNLLMRVFSLVKPMDSLVGPDMEKGLARLGAAAEEGPDA